MAEDPVARAEHVIEQADRFDDLMTQKTERVINDLVAYKQRSQRWQRVIIGMVAVQMLMILIGAFVILKIQDSAATVRSTCEQANASNAIQKGLWHFLLDQPPPPNESPDAANIRIAFTAQVDKAFAPLNCSTP